MDPSRCAPLFSSSLFLCFVFERSSRLQWVERARVCVRSPMRCAATAIDSIFATRVMYRAPLIREAVSLNFLLIDYLFFLFFLFFLVVVVVVKGKVERHLTSFFPGGREARGVRVHPRTHTHTQVSIYMRPFNSFVCLLVCLAGLLPSFFDCGTVFVFCILFFLL